MRLLISTALALTAALVAAGPAIELIGGAEQSAQGLKVASRFTTTPATGSKAMADGTYQDGIDGRRRVYQRPSHNGALIFGTNTSNNPGRTLQFFFDKLPVVRRTASLRGGRSLSTNPAAFKETSLREAALSQLAALMAMTTAEGELPMWIKFNIPLDSDPAYWNVCFDSRKVVTPCSQDASNTSTDARIRRIASDEWRISANSTDRGRPMIRDITAGRTAQYTSMGTYSMPFTLTVKCLNADRVPVMSRAPPTRDGAVDATGTAPDPRPAGGFDQP